MLYDISAKPACNIRDCTLEEYLSHCYLADSIHHDFIKRCYDKGIVLSNSQEIYFHTKHNGSTSLMLVTLGITSDIDKKPMKKAFKKLNIMSDSQGIPVFGFMEVDSKYKMCYNYISSVFKSNELDEWNKIMRNRERVRIIDKILQEI